MVTIGFDPFPSSISNHLREWGNLPPELEFLLVRELIHLSPRLLDAAGKSTRAKWENRLSVGRMFRSFHRMMQVVWLPYVTIPSHGWFMTLFYPHEYRYWLVVEPTPLKIISSSIGKDDNTIHEMEKKNMFEATNQFPVSSMPSLISLISGFTGHFTGHLVKPPAALT